MVKATLSGTPPENDLNDERHVGLSYRNLFQESCASYSECPIRVQ